MTDVLLARIVSGRTWRLDLGEQLLLERQILEHGLDDVIGIAHGFGEIGARASRARPRAASSPRSLRFAEMRAFDRVEARLLRVGDRHLVAGEREHLRNAVAHEAGADDSDARFAGRHVLTPSFRTPQSGDLESRPALRDTFWIPGSRPPSRL